LVNDPTAFWSSSSTNPTFSMPPMGRYRQLADVWRQVSRDPAVRVAAIAGAGSAFSVGGDLRWIEDAIGERMRRRPWLHPVRSILRWGSDADERQLNSGAKSPSHSGTTLATLGRRGTNAPAWFSKALNHPRRYTDIDVDGCRIHLRSWGDPTLPVLVLVHGGGAHSGWWDHIAPFFAQTHHVIAPDLSGHGDSGQRTDYSLRIWAREVIATATAVDSAARPTVVGHSMGGWVAATAAVHYGAALEGIVVIDSPLRDRAPEGGRLQDRGSNAKGYRSREEIAARFRAIPDQPVSLPHIADHIAMQSVRQRDGGWYWKFDPRVFALPEQEFGTTDPEPLERMLDGLRCRTGYLWCENGIVPKQMAQIIQSVLQLRGPFVELPDSGHHPMLDHPLALVAALRTLLEVWSIS
jgi:pimeloyl-ACP methyl ester carboxylesterase